MDDLHDKLHLIASKLFEEYRGFQLSSDDPELTSFVPERRRAGRYTLEEAAIFVAINARARAKNILNSMMDAVALRTLTIHQPWLDEVYLTDVVRPWRDEVYGGTMNDWLEANHPRIGRIFPVSEPKVLLGKAEVSFDEPLPGKLPKVAIGVLAIRAAMSIERNTTRSASAKNVIKVLQEWADEGRVPDILIRSDKVNSKVYWLTKSKGEKPYGVDACEKTLYNWEKSRLQHESNPAVKTVAPL